MPIRPAERVARTLSFEQFWLWLGAHHNCIVRGGTPDVLLFDHEDYHWHLFTEDDGAYIVQLVRGKELVGELVVVANDIAYVQSEPNEHDEHVFECIVESAEHRDSAYQFVMAHPFDEADQPPTARRWTH